MKEVYKRGSLLWMCDLNPSVFLVKEVWMSVETTWQLWGREGETTLRVFVYSVFRWAFQPLTWRWRRERKSKMQHRSLSRVEVVLSAGRCLVYRPGTRTEVIWVVCEWERGSCGIQMERGREKNSKTITAGKQLANPIIHTRRHECLHKVKLKGSELDQNRD